VPGPDPSRRTPKAVAEAGRTSTTGHQKNQMVSLSDPDRPHTSADPKKPLNRHDAVRLSSRRSQGRQGCDVSNSRPKNAKTGLWGIQEFRSFPPISHFGLGVPGTQRRRWVSLAVENFGLGMIPMKGARPFLRCQDGSLLSTSPCRPSCLDARHAGGPPPVAPPGSIVVGLCGGVAAGRTQPAHSELRRRGRRARVPDEVGSWPPRCTRAASPGTGSVLAGRRLGPREGGLGRFA